MLLLLALPARAQRPAYDLRVRVDPQRRLVEGRVRISLINTSAAPLTRVLLWCYPDRFSRRPPLLNDFNFYWAYPYRFDPGWLHIHAMQVDGRPATFSFSDDAFAGPRTLLQVPLASAVPPGGGVTLLIDYQVQVPNRYGAFGCFRDTCTLGGGFYPMLPPLRPGGFDLRTLPARGDFDVTVTGPGALSVVLQGTLYRSPPGQPVQAHLRDVPAPALVVSAAPYRTLDIVHRGVRVRYHVHAPVPLPTPKGYVVPYWPADRAGPVLDAARRLIDLLAVLGRPVPAGETLYLVEGALRTEVAQALPGVVLVSDRIFDTFPLHSLQAAQEAALVRAIGDEYVARHGREPPADQGWAPDLAASFLADDQRLDAPGSVRADVAKLGFLPEADRILYAPQVPFSSTYFYTTADPDPFRDELSQWNNDLPRGRRIYAKLLDLMGGQRVEQVVLRQIAGEPVRQAAEAVYGAPLGWFFAQWLGPLPAVDYRILRIDKSRQGGRSRVAILVAKVGPGPPIEPVEVAVRDRAGHTLRQTWDGHGSDHRYVFDLPSPAAVIELDPRGRLDQNLPGDNNDPRFGDRVPSRWKALLDKSDLSVGAGTVTLDVDVSLSRVRDLKHALHIGVVRNDQITLGLSAAYVRSFGRKVTPASLGWSFITQVLAARVPALGTGADSVPGQAFTLTAGLAYDDRLYLWEPVRARALSLAASYTLTALDNATTASRGTITASAEKITPLADGHGLALLLSGGITFGHIAAAQQLISAGGPAGLRGFSQLDLLGQAAVFGRVEYRHVFNHSLNINLMSTYYLAGVSGSLFAEGALVTACQSYAVDTQSGAFDVGYTVNLLARWFGITPNRVAMGLAVPIVRPQRACLGMPAPTSRPPVVAVFEFGPPW